MDKRQKWVFTENQQKILTFLKKKSSILQGVTRRDILTQTKFSRRTLRKHLKVLKDASMITEENKRIFFRVQHESLKEFERLLQKMAVMEMEKAKKTEPSFGSLSLSERLNHYCFVFIGTIPIAFPKTVENMTNYMDYMEWLMESHQRDLGPYLNEYNIACVIGNKKIISRIDAKIRDEVGWTVEEYFEKLVNESNGGPGIRPTMSILGIADEGEMLREMGYTEA